MNIEKQNIGRKIYLLCPTIRVNKFIETHKIWMSNSKTPENIITKVVVDYIKDYEFLSKQKYDVIHYNKVNKGVCKPLYYLTSQLDVQDTDILVVISDDFTPPKNWDQFLLNVYTKIERGVISVEIDGPNDGARNFIISLPILDGYSFKKLNRMIYHPSYNHMYSDNELYDISKELGLLKILKDTGYKFKHHHWSSGGRKFDENDKNIGGDIYKYDKNNYFKRKSQKIEKKIKWFKLSILISSLESRKNMLNHLLFILKPQINDDTEVVISVDKGQQPIGKKRNQLIDNALGEYVCFIDDDDDVSDDYVRLILEGIDKNPDCIGITGIITTNGKNPKRFIHSIKNDKWETCSETGNFLRYPNHLNPIRRKIVEEIKFDSNKKFGEDKCFSDRIKKMLKTEYYIDQPIYYYLYVTKNKSYLMK